MGVKLVIFDWSGTVIDDREPVYETIARLLKIHNKTIMPFDEWVSIVSTSPSSLVLSEFILKNFGVEYNGSELYDMYKKILSEVVTDGIKSVSYSDASDVFKYLTSMGKKIAIVSFQPRDHILKEADEHGLTQFIARIVGDAFDKSAHLTYLCKEFNIDSADVLFVGDMVGDIQAAKIAGIKSVAVATGYHSKEFLLTEKPDYIISSLSDLKGII